MFEEGDGDDWGDNLYLSETGEQLGLVQDSYILSMVRICGIHTCSFSCCGCYHYLLQRMKFSVYNLIS